MRQVILGAGLLALLGLPGWARLPEGAHNLEAHRVLPGDAATELSDPSETDRLPGRPRPGDARSEVHVATEESFPQSLNAMAPVLHRPGVPRFVSRARPLVHHHPRVGPAGDRPPAMAVDVGRPHLLAAAPAAPGQAGAVMRGQSAPLTPGQSAPTTPGQPTQALGAQGQASRTPPLAEVPMPSPLVLHPSWLRRQDTLLPPHSTVGAAALVSVLASLGLVGLVLWRLRY